MLPSWKWLKGGGDEASCSTKVHAAQGGVAEPILVALEPEEYLEKLRKEQAQQEGEKKYHYYQI